MTSIANAAMVKANKCNFPEMFTLSDFFSVYLQGWKKSFKLKGRSKRIDYWIFILQSAFLAALGIALSNLAFNHLPEALSHTWMALFALFLLGSLVPITTYRVRRIRDATGSGWHFLWSLIPYIGEIIAFIICVLPSSKS